MQTPNLHTVTAEELIEKSKETLSKLATFNFKPYIFRFVAMWLVFLAMLFTLISTIVLALTIWP